MNDHELTKMLRQMPAPEPSEGFEQRVLATATAGLETPRRSRVPHWPLAMAAGVVMAIGMVVAVTVNQPVPGPAVPAVAAVDVEPFKVRMVNVVLRSNQALEGATLTIELAPNIALDEHPTLHSLSWQTDIKAGANLLALPIRRFDDRSGEILVTLQHGDVHERLTVHVNGNN